MLPAVLGGIAAAGLVANTYATYKNYQQQGKQLAYNKKLQKQMFAREDTAYRRAVTDLEAAGFSPMLATGAKADAGPIVKTDPPQVDTSGINSTISNAANLAQLMKMQADISMTEEQRKLLAAQTKRTNVETSTKFHDYKIFKKFNTPSNSSGIPKTLRDTIQMLRGGDVDRTVDAYKKAIINKDGKVNWFGREKKIPKADKYKNQRMKQYYKGGK